MFSTIAKLFSGGLVNSIEAVALEYIQTDKESAEAKALMVKTLDPNGAMRRDLSKFASKAYGFYLVCTVLLIFIYAAFGIFAGAEVTENITAQKEAIAEAVHAMTDLFVPVTTAWGTIVTASFGVNMTNSIKGQ